MSCVLSNIGCFQDISSVRRFLFPDLQEEEKPDLDGWEDADWGWERDDKSDGKTESKADDESSNWLQECAVSLSPTNDLIVVGFEERAVFLQQKWDPQKDGGSDYQYHIVYKGEVNQEEGECITSVMCVPLASQKRSSQGAPDWTCVMVGYTSGYIRMYTETGSLLLSQLLHEDPVLKLKCRTYEMPRYPGVGEQQEELTILYPTALVTVDGFSLFQSLRACRNQLARAAASGTDVVQPPPLAYKKWGLLRQEAITDQASCGVITPCSFDQLNAECMVGGYSTNVRVTPPAASRYVTTGTGPYIGFFYALEGSSQPLISDVAIAMASKLKSAFLNAASGWFGFGGQAPNQSEQVTKQKPKVELATSLPIRFGIPDLRRHGDTICVSPGLGLAVSTDSFGRVVLIDVARGVVIRMWKGYRDAQCGWIQVSEDLHREMSEVKSKRSHRHRHYGPRIALYLVIYAPRRGILEVWNTQQGPRVAAFNVPKSARLLCPGYSMMGLNSTSMQDSRVRPLNYQCALMEVSGLVRTIQVPFHLALSNKNSKRARDLHLVKKLSSMLHHKNSLNEPLEDVIVGIISDIKMTSYKQQALDKVLSSKGIPSMVLAKVVRIISDQLRAQGPDMLDYEGQCLLQYCSVQSELLQAYNNLVQLQGKPLEGNSDEAITEDTLAAIAGLDTSDLKNWLEHLKVYLDAVCQTRVHFASDHHMDTTAFLSCFQHVVSHARIETKKKEGEEGGGEGEGGGSRKGSSQGGREELNMMLQLKDGLSEELLLQLGTFLFRPCLQGHCSIDALCNNLEILGMSSEQLQIILLQMWLANEENFLKPLSCLHHFYQLMMALSKMAANTTNQPKTPDADPVSMWHQVQSQIRSSSKVGAALVAAIFSKCITMATANQLGQSRSSHDLNPDEIATQPEASQQDAFTDEPEPPSSPLSMDLGSEPPSSLDLSTDWVSVSTDVEHWDVLIHQLEDLLALSCVIHCKPSQEAFSQLEKAATKAWTSSQNSSGLSDNEMQHLSVKRILEGGRGAVAEILASWAAQYAVPPRFLSGCSGSHHNLSSQISCEGTTGMSSSSSRDNVQQEITSLQDLLHRLCKRFPNSLEHDVIQAHCTWEYIVQWNRNPEVTDFFGCALQHLDLIRNAVLRHGVSSMVWHTFTVKRVSASAYLMDKVGKAPKDRLCRRDVGLSETALLKFLELSCELLDRIYQTEAETSLAPVFEIEDSWQHAQGPTPLVELAVAQSLSNHQLVDLHKQLCTIMHAVMVFGMKSVKVLAMFDYVTKNAFFRDLHSTVALSAGSDSDMGLLQNRQQFLCKVTTAAVQTLLPAHAEEDDPQIHHPTSPCTDPSGPNLTRLSKSHAANVWPDTVTQLAVVFHVDVDLVKRHHVCELFRSGYDSIAQEILVTVTEHTQMGVQLMEIAGLRLAQSFIIDTNSVTVEKQSLLPAPVLKWLKEMAADLKITPLRCLRPPLPDTAQLVCSIAGLLPETHSKYPLALQLVEAVGTLT